MEAEEVNFCPICSGLGEEVVERALQIAQRVSFQEGSTVYMQEDPFKGLFVILNGEVRLSSQNEKGKEFLVKRLEAHAVFGESGLINQTYFESAYAQTAVEGIFLSGVEFQKLMAENSKLSEVFVKFLGEWLTEFYKRFHTLSYTSVTDRVKCFLADESQRINSKVLEINLRRHEIASNLGVRPETLSRILASLEKENKIKIESNSTIVLNDIESLTT